MELKPYTEAIKRKINLVDYIGAHVELKQKNGKFTACCPFHDEKTPSFYVHADYFHCFGCQKHGDVFTFATEYLGKKFWETLQELAKKTGVELPQQKEASPEEKKKRLTEQRYFKALADAWKFFAQALPASAKTSTYLTGRGYTKEEIVELPFGYAPTDGPSLHQTLQRAGHKINDLVTLGLCRPSKRGNGYYDFFRDRLMIRIDDEYGRPVAFGGRTLAKASDQGPKYINSPAHPLFKKGELLFNFYAAKPSIQKKRRAILCEGYMDVLKLTQVGFLESVAVLGTAAGPSHLQLVEKYADQLIVVFDGDEAGLRACRRLAPDVARCRNLQVRLLQLPDGHDPDSYVTKFGAEAFEKSITTAPRFLDFVIEKELEEASEKPPGAMIDFLRKSAFSWIKGIRDPMHRDWMFGKIAKQTGIDKSLLMRGAVQTNQNTRRENTGIRVGGDVESHVSGASPNPRQQGPQDMPAEQKDPAEEVRRYVNLRSRPVLRAVAGALLFAEPSDFETGPTKKWMDGNLSLPKSVLDALTFLLERHIEGKSANDLTLKLVSSWEMQLFPLKDQFEGRAKDHMREVAVRIKQQRLKSTISGLKNQLKQSTEPETQHRLALEIQELERSRV